MLAGIKSRSTTTSSCPQEYTFHRPDKITLGKRESDTKGPRQYIHKVQNCVADKSVREGQNQGFDFRKQDGTDRPVKPIVISTKGVESKRVFRPNFNQLLLKQILAFPLSVQRRNLPLLSRDAWEHRVPALWAWGADPGGSRQAAHKPKDSGELQPPSGC